jgi:hypothetical protein
MILANSSCKMLQIAIAQVQIHDGPPSDAVDPRGRIETYGKICRNCIQFWSSLSQFQHPWLRHRIEAIWSPNLITWQICFLAWRLGTNLLLGTVRRGRRSLIEFWASICRVPEGSRGFQRAQRHYAACQVYLPWGWGFCTGKRTCLSHTSEWRLTLWSRHVFLFGLRSRSVFTCFPTISYPHSRFVYVGCASHVCTDVLLYLQRCKTSDLMLATLVHTCPSMSQ